MKWKSIGIILGFVLFLFVSTMALADATQNYRGSQYLSVECSAEQFEIGGVISKNLGIAQNFELEWFAIDRDTGNAYLLTTTGDVWLNHGESLTRWYATDSRILVVVLSTQYSQAISYTKIMNYCA